MKADFPELTTIGALFKFAKELERVAAEVVGRLAGDDEDLQRIAKKHKRREDEIERARKEKMNETVLEPLTAIQNEPYIPELDHINESSDEPALREAAKGIEERSAKFYADAADKAGPVLAEVKRTFQRYAKDNGKYRKALGQ